MQAPEHVGSDVRKLVHDPDIRGGKSSNLQRHATQCGRRTGTASAAAAIARVTGGAPGAAVIAVAAAAAIHIASLFTARLRCLCR